MRHDDDYFTPSSPWYYILQIGTPVYFAAFLASTVLLINADFPIDYARSSPPGQYFSLRYHDLQWVACMFYSMAFFVPFVVYALIAFRRSRGCYHVWSALLVILTLAEIFVVFALLPFYANANKSGSRDNKFNSPLWCCRPEIYGNPANGCPNIAACSITVTETPSNPDYVWIFWTAVLFWFADMFIVAFFSGVFTVQPYEYSRYAFEEEEGPKFTKGE